MEPNAGTNGIVAPENYWPLLRAHTRERGVYLIADEVMSGFGRCGEWFAWQRDGEDGRPDLMTLAKGLTGAHLPLGAVVMSAEIARRLENEMLYTGLTYCGHPLSCAAGVAAIEAYESEGLIERSRRLGAQLLRELKKLQERHAIVGDVRGGHGLFAVVELVRDRASKAPPSAWPDAHPAMTKLVKDALARDVSFATRGNLIILAPPLVIEEKELQDALSLLDELVGRMTAMSYKLTYSTMFDPPPEMHARFDAAMREVRSQLGRRHALHIGGADVDTATARDKRSPIDRDWLLGSFAQAGAQDVDRAMAAAAAAFPKWRATAAAGAHAPAAQSRAAHRRARVSHRRRAHARSRQEPHGSARRSAGDRGLLQRVLRRLRASAGIRSRAAERSAAERGLAQSQRDEAVRRVGRDQPVQFSVRTRGRSRRCGARDREHGRAERRERDAVGRTHARGLSARRGVAARRVQLPDGAGRRDRRCARARPAHGRRDVHRFVPDRHAHRPHAGERQISTTVYRGDGRQERRHRDCERGSGTRGGRHRAQRLRHGRAEVLGVVATVRAVVGGRRVDRSREQEGRGARRRRPDSRGELARTGGQRESAAQLPDVHRAAAQRRREHPLRRARTAGRRSVARVLCAADARRGAGRRGFVARGDVPADRHAAADPRPERRHRARERFRSRPHGGHVRLARRKSSGFSRRSKPA